MPKNLWEPPRLRTAEGADEERRATWLELFFDLIFVVAIAELGHLLVDNVSLTGFLGFAALFALVWWCWMGATFYATRFDTDDVGYRSLTLLQMTTLVALAINLHDAFGKGAIAFTICYVAFRAVLVIQYLNAGHHVEAARPYTILLARGFALGLIPGLVSIFVPAPWRFWLWALGLLIDLATPVVAQKHVLKAPPNIPHITERLGLFVIIVLGESFWAVIQSVSKQVWTSSAIATALSGLVIAYSFWWIYFDSVDGSPMKSIRVGKSYIAMTWLYSHLPLAIGLATTGIGVKYFIKYADKGVPEGDHWLLCGGVILCLLSLSLIHYITCTLGGRKKILSAYRLGSAAFVSVVALFGTNVTPVVQMMLVSIACLIQVLLALWENQRVTA
jgi:low temperature requirement protein LtrA